MHVVPAPDLAEDDGRTTLLGWGPNVPAEHRFWTALGASLRYTERMSELDGTAVDAAAVCVDESARLALGTRTLTVFAIDPTGGPVGHTQVQVNPFRPDASWQWDTVVLDHHRRRGIGRWLKAEMWQWLRADAPEVDRLLTGNAESNAGMLAINVAMGFTESHVFGAWQTDIGTYRCKLS